MKKKQSSPEREWERKEEEEEKKKITHHPIIQEQSLLPFDLFLSKHFSMQFLHSSDYEYIQFCFFPDNILIWAFPHYLTFFLCNFDSCVIFHHADILWFILSFSCSSTFKLFLNFSIMNNIVVSILFFPSFISCYFFRNAFQKWNRWVKTRRYLKLLMHVTLPNCFLSRLCKFTFPSTKWKPCFIIW